VEHNAAQSAKSQLEALRTKTSLQLLALADRKLDRGLALARVFPAGESHVRAERVYAEVSTWLPWVGAIDASERGRLEAKLEELRRTLDRGARVQTACG
jgi:hypothetical protein